MIQIGKTTDLLNCEPVANQIRMHGQEEVLNVVKKSVLKLLMSVGQSIDPIFIEMTAEDLMDKYRLDSIEDIVECLKKGRQGTYGKVFGKVNMIVISEWMSIHLEDKYRERERHVHNQKEGNEAKHNNIDYEAFKMRNDKDQEKDRARKVSAVNSEAWRKSQEDNE